MNRLRIIIAHNVYRQRGGEDIVAEQEAALLERHGHDVVRFTRDNHDIHGHGSGVAIDTIWSTDTFAAVAQLIDRFQPDVIHAHNTFPLISPSLYWAAARRNVPVVQTLHNFRLLCPQAMLLRGGKVCEDCVGRIPWRAVLHSCYRDSAAHSAVIAGMLVAHRALGTYRNKVSRYVALNRFCRDKFIAGGLPADKVVVKPNFADVDAPDPQANRSGALFVGRLSQEKGVGVLLDALEHLPERKIHVIGDGPERNRVANHARIVMHGHLAGPAIFAAMRRHSYLVLPSIWYENAPRTLVEAFGCGLPVIASKIGALAELVRHGETGLLFEPNSPRSLAETMSWANEHHDAMLDMGRRARREFEDRYTPERNYRTLMSIYGEAIQFNSMQSDLAGASS
jgi:glycosyltransferase involved in cell wall biosynthesis